MLEMMAHDFFWKSILAGVLISALTAPIGVLLIMRRMSLLGEGLAHASFGGVALGFLLNINPILTALVFTLASSLGIRKFVDKSDVYGDSAIAVVFSLGVATAVLIIGWVDGFGANLHSYLFGSILSTSNTELWLMGGSLLLMTVFLYFFRNQIVLSSFSNSFAKAQGVRTNYLELGLVLLASVAVVVSIRAVGILLVTALLVIPGLAALKIAGSFKKTIIYSVMLSQVGMLAGILVSFALDLPPSGAIVFALTGLLGLAYLPSIGEGSSSDGEAGCEGCEHGV